MKHMGNDERNRIEFMLGCGSNVASIAKALGRSESTMRRCAGWARRLLRPHGRGSPSTR